MSPTAEAQMVKLPKTLVARLDAARGDVARPVFLDSLLDEYEKQDGHAQPVTAGMAEAMAGPAPEKRRTVRSSVKRPDPTRVEKGSLVGRGDVVSPGSCPHPSARRIGDGCAACGTTGLKALGKR